MLIYSNTFENTKTTNIDFPVEDQFFASNNEAIIADGITRDPIGISDFSKITFEEFINKYPKPSGGELAAKTIIQSFSKSKGTLFDRLIKCNEDVKELNRKHIKKCDYLENDYYGAVASCVNIKDNYLNYAYICDCGVIVYDELGNIKFQTEDDKLLYSDPFINKLGIPWNLANTRRKVRREYRNNINNIINNKCASYGALTGEKDAIHFIKTGKLEINDSDTIVLYSDGFSELLYIKEFINKVINFNHNDFNNYVNQISLTNYEKYGKEKTIIILKK